MADEARRAKIIRSNKMSAFTRKRNHLQSLIDGAAPSAKLLEVYAELSEAYSSLEKAQEDFMLVVDEETLEAEGAYLDNPSSGLADMDLKVSKASDTHNKLNPIRHGVLDLRLGLGHWGTLCPPHFPGYRTKIFGSEYRYAI